RGLLPKEFFCKNLCFKCSLCRDAAFPGGNRAAVRAGARMPKERTDALGSLRREDMFKLAGLLGDFLFVVYVEGLSKEPFGQPVAADHILCALAALFSKDDHVIAVAGVLAGRTKRHMAAVEPL